MVEGERGSFLKWGGGTLGSVSPWMMHILENKNGYIQYATTIAFYAAYQC